VDLAEEKGLGEGGDILAAAAGVGLGALRDGFSDGDALTLDHRLRRPASAV